MPADIAGGLKEVSKQADFKEKAVSIPIPPADGFNPAPACIAACLADSGISDGPAMV